MKIEIDITKEEIAEMMRAFEWLVFESPEHHIFAKIITAIDKKKKTKGRR